MVLADLSSERRPRRATGSDERALVEHAQRGSEPAFAKLVDRYGDPVMSLCYASTLNPIDAEDLAQEVFLAAWRGLPRYRGQAAFSTWLFSIARNACVDRARRAAARPVLADERELPDAPAADDGPRRTARAILAAAAELRAELRQALLLRDLQGLSYEEIAGLQDVPVGTVRSRIAAARSAVVERLEREWHT